MLLERVPFFPAEAAHEHATPPWPRPGGKGFWVWSWVFWRRGEIRTKLSQNGSFTHWSWLKQPSRSNMLLRAWELPAYPVFFCSLQLPQLVAMTLVSSSHINQCPLQSASLSNVWGRWKRERQKRREQRHCILGGKLISNLCLLSRDIKYPRAYH